MANPTRLQIEASFNLPKYKVELDHAGSYYTLNNDHITEVTGDILSNGNNLNGISFGTYVEPKATVKVLRRNVLNVSLSDGYESSYWIKRKIRISQAFDTSDYIPMFVGIIDSYTIDGEILTYNIIGVLEFVRNTKIYTEATYNRPIASATSASSIENPATIGYAGGTINRILWESGGRPIEQRLLVYADADAKFWYSCEQSLFNPEWTWIAGENLVDELFMLARSSGGQIYQDVNADGVAVIRFVQPLTIASREGYTSYYNFDASKYTSFSKTLSGVETVSTVRCNFKSRRLYVMQNVYEDTTPKFLRTGETKTFDLSMQLPVYEYGVIDAGSVKAFAGHNNTAVTLSVTVTHKTAAKVSLSIYNNIGYPVTINSIVIKGRPLAVQEEGMVTYGSDIPVQDLEDNPYIQSYSHAMRLCRMVYDFYSEYRPTITLRGCIYDTDRYVGEVVQVANNDNVYYNGATFVQDVGYYRIISINHANTGSSMDITLVSLADLPQRPLMYIVDETYINTDVRLISY
jgi:hypothetical protein